ncbi:MAG: hypothetical protein ABJC19_10100 [Gemmatimonadota bacterium]
MGYLTAVVQSAQVSAITTRQQETGLWGEGFLAFEPIPNRDVLEVGTVAQYRRLVQLGVPNSTRPFRLADRALFRVFSRDDDPLLLGEFDEAVEEEPKTGEWYRNLIRDGAAAALAEAGHEEDPRLRGAAHKVVNSISAFLRSPLVEDPLIKRSGGFQLHPDAAPPSWWSLAMLSAMPGLQRERGGFVERLGQYLAQPAPSRSYMIPIGSKTMKPTHVLLGDPIELDSKGQLKDVPLALHYIELLAGMGQTQLLAAPNTVMAFQRLLEDLDGDGVWHPKNLRSQPKAASPVSYHCWPLAPDDGGLTARQADITFRLALIAKRLGWRLEFS